MELFFWSFRRLGDLYTASGTRCAKHELFGGMFFLFWLILWRPQSKRAKEHQELVSGISKGDEVMTSGGLLGKVTRVQDDYIAIEVADGVELKLQKSSVAAALPKGTINQI